MLCPTCNRKYRVTFSGRLRRHACHSRALSRASAYVVELQRGGSITILSAFDFTRLGVDERQLVNAIADAIQHYKLRQKEQKQMGETVTIPAGTLIHVAGIPFRTTTDTVVEGTATNLSLALASLADTTATPGTGAVSGATA